MGNPVEKPSPGHLWVEAELLSNSTHVNVEPADVRVARSSEEQFGSPSFIVNAKQLTGSPSFPARFIPDLMAGRAVRFQMRYEMFGRAVQAATRSAARSGLNGLDGDLVHGKFGHRPLHVIAGEVALSWKNPYFGAIPYLQAMLRLDDIDDTYGYDSARSIVAYFLSNAQTWRGPKAREIKTELKKLYRSGGHGGFKGLEAPHLSWWAEEDESPTYRWIITKDYISGGEEKGIQGPRGADLNLKTNRAHFVMKDDDGEVYYEGDIYGDYDGFEPLEDFGMPNAGATSIWYKGKML